MLAGEHLILEALVEPTIGLTTVKAYFRANLYPQFYYVEMVLVGDVYQGILPKPKPEITGLHYYLEAMDSSFNSVRTAEYTPEIVSNEASCRDQNPTPAAYLDGPGAITVGSTGPGPAMPSGFFSEGIAGTLPAIGRTTGGGGGLLIGGVAATGAAVGVGVLLAGGDDSAANSTTTIASSDTTASVPAATTTLPTVNVMACFETSPSPPRIEVGGSVRFEASCTQPPLEEIRSYVWDFNDGRTGRDTRVVSRVYNNPGTFAAVLTVTTLGGEQDTFETDVVVEESLPPGGGGGPGGPTTTVPGNDELQFIHTNIQGGTSGPVPGNNGGGLTTIASLTAASPDAPRRTNTRLTSHLELPPGDGSTQAQVTFNEFSSAVTDNSGPSTHEVPGRSGDNIVEGFVTRNPRGEGVWRFDFRGAPGFVPGSFLIDTGQVVSRQTHELVFRVAPGVRRVRFRYRLE